MNPDEIEAEISENTKAIIPVHVHGLYADMSRINTVAKQHKLLVVEDACQALGAEYMGKKSGALSDLISRVSPVSTGSGWRCED
jgi:dTDP-4-amino-4,6-dideoxygalactose transaminase